MKRINVYLTVAILLLYLQSFAQKYDNQYLKRLYIGDKVDMASIVFNNVRNYPGGKAKLSDFKGKYIILDFWNKRCSSCIASFPHMEELQNQFKDDIQVLLVTKNSEAELLSLFKRSENLKKSKLPLVLGDSILYEHLFKHGGSDPHHVWLDKTGKVLAITYSSETNKENLTKLISGGVINLLIKDNIDPMLLRDIKNPTISFLKAGKGMLLNYLRYFADLPAQKRIDDLRQPISLMLNAPYYSFFTRQITSDKGVGNIFLQDSLGNIKGFKFFNSPIPLLYSVAYKNKSSSPFSKIIAEGKAKSQYEEKTDTTNLSLYDYNNRFCYESSLPEYSVESAKKILQQDLSRFFGMSGNIEERSMRCLVLTRLSTSQANNLWMKGNSIPPDSDKRRKLKDGLVFKGVIASEIYSQLKDANSNAQYPVIFDETNFSSEEQQRLIDVKLNLQDFKGTDENILLMRREFAKYGLGLKQEFRKLNVLVLRSTL